jgi:hypothetical protein
MYSRSKGPAPPVLPAFRPRRVTPPHPEFAVTQLRIDMGRHLGVNARVIVTPHLGVNARVIVTPPELPVSS